MGDVLDGVFKNFGISGGQNYVKNIPTYLGENEFQKPLEDIMGLLASEANQQRAQRNLMFGGAGYGGSFETAAQKAQRAAGQPVDNTKPYGGWGGYGSNNPVMAWDPTGTRPDWMQSAPPPPAGAPPPRPPGGPITGGPPEPIPPGAPPPRPPGGPVTMPVPPRDGPSTPIPNPPRRGNFGDAPQNQGGDFFSVLMDAIRQTQAPSAGERSTAPTAGANRFAGTVHGANPGVSKVFDMLESAGIPTTHLRAENVSEAISRGVDPGTLANHYYNEVKGASKGTSPQQLAEGAYHAWLKNHSGGLVNHDMLDGLAKAGPTSFSAPQQGLATRAQMDGYHGNAYASPHASTIPTVDPAQAAAARASWIAGKRGGAPPTPSTAPARTASTGSRTNVAGLADGYEAAMTATAPPGSEASTVYGGPSWSPPRRAQDGDAWTSPWGTVYTFKNGVWVDGNDKPMAGQPGNTGGGVSPPTGVDGGGGGSGPPVTGGGGGAGGEGGTGNPATGAMTWDRFLKVLQYWHPEMTPEELTDEYKAWYEDGLANGFDPAWQSDPRYQSLMDRYNPPVNPSDEPQRPSQFGPQGFNPTQVQKRDSEGKLMFDPNTGDPIMEDIDPSQTTDGSGYAVGDAWSTSPLWRPEAPTGGLYGAYSEMAGGNLTPYENRIMEGWQGRAADPMGWADEKTLASIDSYEKTPGRGEDEAYGAYNTMLQGGYSPEEQNAITQEGMRAARAGYETNRDSMLRNQARTNNSAGYAANMAKMARGFGETMGSQGRQNQILFADETQKRRETGAGGMLNVAGLANQRGQASIAARSGFGTEMARRQETGLQGMQSAAGYGRDVQKQGLAGLHALYQGSDPTNAWGQAAEIGSKPRENWTKTSGTSGGV